MTRPAARLHVLRVFTGDEGAGGNPLGVFLNGNEVPPQQRQESAAALGYSETVFVDDAAAAAVRIFTPATELAFAGHPLVGTSWLLAREGHSVAALSPPVGRVPTWHDAGRTWIRGRPEWAPPMQVMRLGHADDVDTLSQAPVAGDFVYVWAWQDEAAGCVRARAFASGIGVREDEATGAAAVRLAALLNRPLVIRQGTGSVLHARPAEGGAVDVGGSVALDDVRTFAL